MRRTENFLTKSITMGFFLHERTRFLFFAGKGGVGRTSHLCMMSTALADIKKKINYL